MIIGKITEKRNDPRFANIVEAWKNDEKYDISIMGAPSDSGVISGGGRAGAELAPRAIREQLCRYGTATNIEYGIDLRVLRLADAGDVSFCRETSEMHSRVETKVKELLANSKTVIVFGGGHDLSYASVSALSSHHGAKYVGGVNIDAHFDVRPVVGGVITSGTPFWRLIVGGHLHGKNFTEIGAQGHVNARAHYDFLKDCGAEIVFLSRARHNMKSVLKNAAKDCFFCDALFVSIDMDSAAQAFAPGVSAPSPDGFSPEDILHAAYFAGRNPKVRLFEIMEVNPRYDVDGRTARLAANLVLEFCAGFAQRR